MYFCMTFVTLRSEYYKRAFLPQLEQIFKLEISISNLYRVFLQQNLVQNLTGFKPEGGGVRILCQKLNHLFKTS